MNLDEQKQKLLADLASLTARIASNQETLGLKRESSSVDDIASLYEMQAKAQSAISTDQQDIIKIRKAIQRIDEDEYAYCSACGDDINPKRLAAVPTVTTCIDCANMADLKNRLFA